MSHHLVELDMLGFTYPDGTRALESVSFRITHGECVAIVGGNGAGKSTLLRHLSGCHLPMEGSIRVGNVNIECGTLPLIRRSVGTVFQDADDQLFMPTVEEDVGFGPMNMGLGPDEVKERVDRALKAVGALHLLRRASHNLSGGQKRSVALATVLSMDPSILVLDEPTAGLDHRARRRTMELLKGFGHTRIIATHDLDFVMELCERILVLSEGRLLADGPTSEVLKDELLLREAGLQSPYRNGVCPVCQGKQMHNP